MFDTLRTDTHHALRALRANPAFALVATLSLALGIGANATVFSIINGLLLRPLPVHEPAALVSVYARRGEVSAGSLSYPDFEDIERSTQTLQRVTAFTPPGTQVSLRADNAQAEATPAALVSRDYFAVLGLSALRGRLLGRADDEAARKGEVAAVISERLWRRRFNGDAALLGRQLIINGQSVTLVGVVAEPFAGTYTGLRMDLWLPLSAHPRLIAGHDDLARRDSYFLNVIGRLKPGQTRAAVAAELAIIAERLAREQADPERAGSFTVTATTGVVPFIRRFITGFLGLLMGIVVAVLLVACSNLAGLLLARATARQNDVAVRAALGASRGRLLRQLGAEALLLAIAGAVGGIVLSRLALAALMQAVPNLGIPIQLDFALDGRVWAFAGAAAVVTALLFGVLPALQLTGAPLMAVLRQDAGSPGKRRMRGRSIVVVVQMTLSVLLLSATILLVRGLRSAAQKDLGFDPSGIALLQFDPVMLGYDGSARERLYRQLLERVQVRPEVAAAAIGQYTLLGSRGDAAGIRLPGQKQEQRIAYNAVTPGYFDLLRLQLVQGRVFTNTDTRGSPGVAVVGEAMAKSHWPGARPVGQHFKVGEHDFTVIGVLRDVKYGSVGEVDRPFVFFPLDQIENVRGGAVDVVLHARMRGAAGGGLQMLRSELHALDPDIPATATLMANDIGFSLFPAQLAARIVGACGVIALLLAVVGLHAVAAYTVAWRTRELGIRVALGAEGSDIVRLVLRQSIQLAALGLLFGLPIALGVAQLLRGLLFGVPPTDPLSFAAVALVLGSALLLAGLGPARRALRLDPVQALRSL
jgi:predicted permease